MLTAGNPARHRRHKPRLGPGSAPVRILKQCSAPSARVMDGRRAAGEDAEVAALRELAGQPGRPLGEVAGTALGFSEGELDEPLTR